MTSVNSCGTYAYASESFQETDFLKGYISCELEKHTTERITADLAWLWSEKVDRGFGQRQRGGWGEGKGKDEFDLNVFGSQKGFNVGYQP